jgi:hypothetical protein
MARNGHIRPRANPGAVRPSPPRTAADRGLAATHSQRHGAAARSRRERSAVDQWDQLDEDELGVFGEVDDLDEVLDLVFVCEHEDPVGVKARSAMPACRSQLIRGRGSAGSR